VSRHQRRRRTLAALRRQKSRLRLSRR